MYYQEDLAYVHHSRYGAIAVQAANYLIPRLQERGWHSARITDLGCGSGILAQLLAEKGHRVTGIDQSAEMIELAKQNVPAATFICGSFLDTPIPESEAVVSTGECFNYLFDERNGLEALQKLFISIYKALSPGGLFIFDMLGPGAGGAQGGYYRIIEETDMTLFLEVKENKETKHLIRDITLFRKQGTQYRKSKETHHVALYEPETIAEMLSNTGFQSSLLDEYDETPFRKGHYGFEAVKR